MAPMASQFMAAAYRNPRLAWAESGSVLASFPAATPRRTEENHMLDITTLAACGEFLGGIAVWLISGESEKAAGGLKR